MIIPIRCYTCQCVVADKYETYIAMVQEEYNKQFEGLTYDYDFKQNTALAQKACIEGKVLDKMGIKRYCCRRMYLGHVDIFDMIRNKLHDA